MNTKPTLAVCVATLLTAFNFHLAPAFAQGTAFTYQGRLQDGANLANGSYDLRFTLFEDSIPGGGLLGVPITHNATGVTNGLFTVTLDFGGWIGYPDPWLEISVRTNGSGAFAILNPRQRITPTPQAVHAASAGTAASVEAANVSGTMTLEQLPVGLLTNNASDVILTGTFTGDGAGLINLDGSQLTSGVVADARLSSNVALRSGGKTFSGSQSFAGPVSVSSGITSATGNSQFNFNGGYGDVTMTLRQRSAADNVILAVQDTLTFNRLQVTTNGISVVGNVVSTGTNTAGAFAGNGAGLTSLDAGNLATGTIGDARLSGTVSKLGQTIESIEIVDGTLVNADVSASAAIADTKLATISTAGKVADSALSANVALRAGGNTFAGNQNFAGAVSVSSGISSSSGNSQFNFNGGYGDVTMTLRQRAGDNIMLAVQDTATFNRFLVTPAGASVTGDIAASGTNTAAAFVGNGAGLTGLNGANITAGKLADSALSSNVALRAGGNTFTGNQIITNGNVGIGTTSPGRPLQVGGANGSEGMMRFSSVSTLGLANRTWEVGVPMNETNTSGKFYSFVIDDTQLGSEPELLVQYFTGNVGIGTTNPLAKLDVNGSIRATSIEASGGNLTGLNASQLTSGTVSLARLPAAVVTNGALGVTLSGTLGGNGAGLTNLNAAQLASGTVPLARLPNGLVTNSASGVSLSGTFSGDGAGLTNLNASQLTSGSLADARLSTNVALLNRTNQSFSGNNIFNQLGVQGTNPLEFGVGHPNRDPFEGSIAYRFDSGGPGGLASSSLDIAGARVGGSDPRIVRVFDSLFVGNLLFVGGVTQNVGVKREALNNAFEVEGNASKTVAGSWLANSDARIKQDIQRIEGALEKLNQVRLVSFQYTEQYRKDHPSIGTERYLNVVAQEFATVFPDHVKASSERLPDGSKVLQVDTYPLTIYSAAAVQELSRKLEKKDAEIANLQARLEKLEQLLGNRLSGGSR